VGAAVVGAAVGKGVVGASVGDRVGAEVGDGVGKSVGAAVGVDVGMAVVGTAVVGAAVVGEAVVGEAVVGAAVVGAVVVGEAVVGMCVGTEVGLGVVFASWASALMCWSTVALLWCVLLIAGRAPLSDFSWAAARSTTDWFLPVGGEAVGELVWFRRVFAS